MVRKGHDAINPANHYGVSDLDAILKLDIDRIAAPDCVLFHWATSPRLEDALTIMTTWRFPIPRISSGEGPHRHRLLGPQPSRDLLIGTRGNVPLLLPAHNRSR